MGDGCTVDLGLRAARDDIAEKASACTIAPPPVVINPGTSRSYEEAVRNRGVRALGRYRSGRHHLLRRLYSLLRARGNRDLPCARFSVSRYVRALRHMASAQ